MAAAMMNGAPSERIPEPPDPEREARDRREAALARLMAPNAHGHRYTREAAEAILDGQAGHGPVMVGAPDETGRPVPLPPLPGPPADPTPEAVETWRAALVLALWSPQPPHTRPAWCTSPEVARRVADGAVEQLLAMHGRGPAPYDHSPMSMGAGGALLGAKAGPLARPVPGPSPKQIAARERQARRNAKRAARG